MFARTKKAREGVVDAASAVAPYAEQLAEDEKVRNRLVSAVAHAEAARRRALPATGVAATLARLATDEELQQHLKEVRHSIRKAQKRVRRKQSHKVRNTVLVLGGAGAAVAFVPKLRDRFSSNGGGTGSFAGMGSPTTVEEEIEVGVPVTTAYNQWTQFEDFPLFMDGVEHVQQLDDTRLRWVASIGGKRAEWEAKIVEQQPDTRIAWTSLDGRDTRGVVTFDKLGDTRTRIRLAMTYRPQGPIEKVGSAAGLDRRRIRGDLERFRDLIESRGTESGAWRGEVEGGVKTSGATT